MLSKVRFLLLPLVASVALWCSIGISATDDQITQDESQLNLQDGGADNFGWWDSFQTLYGPYGYEFNCDGCQEVVWPAGWGGYGYRSGWGPYQYYCPGLWQ